jgi:hypothetical protein
VKNNNTPISQVEEKIQTLEEKQISNQTMILNKGSIKPKTILNHNSESKYIYQNNHLIIKIQIDFG